MAITDTQADELARALIDASTPKVPKQFDYSPITAISRAKAGSVMDARLLLALAAAMLRTESPTNAEVRSVPAWMGNYLADALAQGGDGKDLLRAFGLKRGRGGNKFTNEWRDAWIAYAVELFKAEGRSDFVAATATLLADVGMKPPSRGSAWTAEAVSDAINAHATRIK